jgi:cell wall-associated NlpC family hydrolase
MYGAGKYHGQVHGPNTLVWLVWSGAFRIKRQDAAAGDLAIWQTHMGIFTDSNHIIAAHDPADGTSVTPAASAGPPLEVMVVRRLKAVSGGKAGPSFLHRRKYG